LKCVARGRLVPRYSSGLLSPKLKYPRDRGKNASAPVSAKKGGSFGHGRQEYLMLRAAKTALYTLLKLNPPRREVIVFDDDVFVLSYPRSGNTWLRILLANLLSNRGDVGFANIEKIIPDIYQNSALRLQHDAQTANPQEP